MSVYFIKVGRYLKIGYSENPERRCQNLWRSTTRYGRPWDLSTKEPRELLAVIDGDKSTEYWVHQSLDDFRSNCEFFIDEQPVRDFIELVTSRPFADDEFPIVTRAAGPFERVSHEHMLPERRVELDRMLARARGAA